MFNPNNKKDMNKIIKNINDTFQNLNSGLGEYQQSLEQVNSDDQVIQDQFNQIFNGLNYLSIIIHNYDAALPEDYKNNLNLSKASFVKRWLQDLTLRINHIGSHQQLDELQTELNNAQVYFQNFSMLLNAEVSKEISEQFEFLQNFALDKHISVDRYSTRLTTAPILSKGLFIKRIHSVKTPSPVSSPVNIKKDTKSAGTPTFKSRKVQFAFSEEGKSDSIREDSDYDTYVSDTSNAPEKSPSLYKQSFNRKR